MAVDLPEQIAAETEAQDLETEDVATESVEEAPAPPKRGRPKGSKDTQPRTRTKPEPHTPSKQYVAPEYDFVAAMEKVREQELLARDALYRSWLPY